MLVGFGIWVGGILDLIEGCRIALAVQLVSVLACERRLLDYAKTKQYSHGKTCAAALNRDGMAKDGKPGFSPPQEPRYLANGAS
jgi:hypothetical protein